MHKYKELKVWQKARKIVKDVYKVSQNFPNEEKFGLTAQIRRCAVSIPSNIAEGSGRGSNKDFANFINISISSAFELETQLILALDLNFIKEEEFESLSEDIQEIQKMLTGFNKNLCNN